MVVFVSEHEAEHMKSYLDELIKCDELHRYEYEFLVDLSKKETLTLNDATMLHAMHKRYC